MDSRNTTKVRVLKNRDCGRLGVIEHLKFDPSNHCLKAVPIEETPEATYEDFS